MNGDEGAKGAQRRDRSGRFNGFRVNLDRVPQLPIYPAQWALDDPRGRAYLVFWTDPVNEKLLVRALFMERTDDDRAVAISSPYILRRRIALERRHQWGGKVLFYVCAGCERPHRHLYPWAVINGRLAQDLNPRCRQCSGLSYLTQGIPGGGPHTEPWLPRAVSDPRMVAPEFPGSLDILPG